jgi:hypothetical protein
MQLTSLEILAAFEDSVTLFGCLHIYVAEHAAKVDRLNENDDEGLYSKM